MQSLKMDKADNCPPIESGKSDKKDASHVLSNSAYLTERDVCSMYLKNTEDQRDKISEFSSNLSYILYSPHISMTNGPEGILFQFPSPELLDRYLNRYCTSISNTLEKIKSLPQRFRIVKKAGQFQVRCIISKKLDEYQRFVEKEGGTIEDLNDPATIGFPNKISVFLLHLKFRVGVQIKHACIRHVNCSECARSGGGWRNHTPPTSSTKSNPALIINLQSLNPGPNHSVSSTPSLAYPTPSKLVSSPVKSTPQVEGPDSPDKEVREKPHGVREVAEEPPGVRVVVEKPTGARKIPEKPPGFLEVAEKPHGVREVAENPPAVREVVEKPPGARKVPEKPPGVREVAEEPPGVREVTEKPPKVQEVVEKPPGARKVPEKPRRVREVAEKPPGVPRPFVKNEPAILTEKDLCSMIFRKSKNFTGEVRALNLNITRLIKLYPIWIANNEDGIVFQFPSLDTLKRVLNKECINGSTSLNQIRNLPQRFMFIKRCQFFQVMIYTTNRLDEISSYLQKNGGMFVFDDKCEPRMIGFTEISSAFIFLQRFSHWNPKINLSCIKELVCDSKPSKPISSYNKTLVVPNLSSPHSHTNHGNASDTTEFTSQATVPIRSILGSYTTEPHVKPAQATIETIGMDSSEPSAQVDEPAELHQIHPEDTGESSTEEKDELRLVSVHNECVEIKSDFLFHPNSVCFLYPVEIDIRDKNQQDIDLSLFPKFGPVTRISMTRNGFLRVWYTSRGDASSAVKQLKDKYPIQALRIEHVCYPQEQEEGKQ